MPDIAEQIKKLGLPPAVESAVSLAAAAGIGTAVGGGAGAASAYNVDLNNRQLHDVEKSAIRTRAKGDEVLADRLNKAACYATQCWAQYPENSKEYAENYVSVMEAYSLKEESIWVKEQQSKGLFLYSPMQRYFDYVQSDFKGTVLPAAGNILKVITGGLSTGTGATMCSTSGVGCVPGTMMIAFGLNNITEGSTGLYNQYKGDGVVGYNPMRHQFNQIFPEIGDPLYLGLDFVTAIAAMGARVPLNVGLKDGLERSTSMFGVTVSQFSNVKLYPLLKWPMPYGTNQASLLVGTALKGKELIESTNEKIGGK